jgi:acyl-CoA synthetase (AMP-forming)/AMP-acid ligase II
VRPYEHPDVCDPAVIGIPHDERGEEVAAAAALMTGTDSTPGERLEFVKQRVAAYEHPRHGGLVDELPRALPARSSSVRSTAGRPWWRCPDDRGPARG